MTATTIEALFRISYSDVGTHKHREEIAMVGLWGDLLEQLEGN